MRVERRGSPFADPAGRRPARLPPAGDRIPFEEGWEALRLRRPEQSLREGLRKLCAVEEVTLHASGREALRVGLEHLAERSGRREVVIPAYTCFSVAASGVAAGLRIRLVDVNLEGQIDLEALEGLPLEGAAALVVSNLVGVPEPTARASALATAAGVAVVDDAAQSLGARDADGPVGGRGEIGLLSFGRGKPLSALGGGALAWSRRPDALDPAPPPRPRRILAVMRAVGYDLALVPQVFRLLAAIPGMNIGETIFDPGFRRGGIDGASLSLAAARLIRLETENERRCARAEDLARRLRGRTRFAPLIAAAGSAAYPRLGVRAPDASLRDLALAELGPLGARRLYPSALDRVEALRPHLVGSTRCPGADEFAERLFTLPTHAQLRRSDVEEIARVLERLS